MNQNLTLQFIAEAPNPETLDDQARVQIEQLRQELLQLKSNDEDFVVTLAEVV